MKKQFHTDISGEAMSLLGLLKEHKRDYLQEPKRVKDNYTAREQYLTLIKLSLFCHSQAFLSV